MAAKSSTRKVRVTAKQVQAHRDRGSRDQSPKWDGAEDWSGEKFTSHFREAMKWYNLESSSKALKPQIINWMSKSGYSKEQIADFKKTKDNRCVITVGAVAACLNKGMPTVHSGFNNGKDTSQWLGKKIAEVISAGKDDADDDDDAVISKPTIPAPSIQERVKEVALSMTEEIESAIESFQADPNTFDPKAFKILNVLRGKGAKAAHAKIIKEFYEKNLIELEELLSVKPDIQLIEGYQHRTKKQIKNLLAFYIEIKNACDMIAEEAKAMRKTRVPKSVSKDKLVSKIKYKKQDDLLKLVSINPVDIIGGKELWIFDTKTRKLGKYVAAEFADLGVKGTTITGFDESKSIQKTLRKPADQLAEFKSSGKVALRKFLEEINAVDIKLNGRVNENVILLKVA